MLSKFNNLPLTVFSFTRVTIKHFIVAQLMPAFQSIPPLFGAVFVSSKTIPVGFLELIGLIKHVNISSKKLD